MIRLITTARLLLREIDTQKHTDTDRSKFELTQTGVILELYDPIYKLLSISTSHSNNKMAEQ